MPASAVGGQVWGVFRRLASPAQKRACELLLSEPIEPHDLGAFGNGSRMKYVANLLVAINNVASAEAMVLGLKAGLPARTVFEMVRTGAGNSRVFELRAPMMVSSRYDHPSMKVSVWQKDMAVIGDFARRLRCPTPMFDATVPIYNKAIRIGHAEHDTAAVCAVLEKAAGVKRRRRK